MTACAPDVFAPPADGAPPGLGLGPAVVAWALAGSVLGTGLAAILAMLRVVHSMAPVALSTAGSCAALGALVWWVARRRSEGRPAVLDGYGRRVRPLGAWVLGTPLALGILGLLGLVLVGTVHTGSLAVGGGFLVVALGFASLFRPLWVSHLLAAAAQAEETGDIGTARATWQRVAASPLATRRGRQQARLNLGMLALGWGDLPEAGEWFDQVRQGRAGAFAAVGRALVAVLEERYDEVTAELAEAAVAGRALQGEVDGVRLLLVLRTDGPQAARALGRQLEGPGAGLLFLGALAVALHRTGSPDEATAMLDRGLGQALEHSAVGRAVPELRELVRDDR